jgi:ParB family chromosome partitioning protein
MDDVAAARAVAADFQNGVARNPVDEGEYLSWMTTEKGVSIAEASRTIGLSRTEGSHRLRVLRLPSPIKELLRSGDLTLGHGRLLLSLAGDLSDSHLVALAQEAHTERLSIHELHDRAAKLSGHGKPSPEASARDPNVVRVENVLSAKLGTPVRIDYTNTGEGVLHIEFDSFSILDGVLDHLGYEG